MSKIPCASRLEALQPSTPKNPSPEELFDTIQLVIHAPDVLLDARHHGLDEADLDDAGSNCLVKLMQNAERIDYGRNWRSYVRVCVLRFIIDITRRKYRHPALPLGPEGIDLAAGEPSAFEQLCKREDRDRLAELLLAGAKGRSRRIVKLRLAGNTFEAIAARLDVSLTVVFRAWSQRVEAAARAAQQEA